MINKIENRGNKIICLKYKWKNKSENRIYKKRWEYIRIIPSLKF